MTTTEEKSSISSSFTETLSTDFISREEIESMARTQKEAVQKLQNASKKLDLFTHKSKENMADSKEKLAEADESLRNIAEDLRCIHGVCARVKKGLKSASQANPRGVWEKKVVRYLERILELSISTCSFI